MPSPGLTQIRIFSGIPGCQYTIKTNNTKIPDINLKGIDYWYDKYINVEHQNITMNYTFQEDNAGISKIILSI